MAEHPDRLALRANGSAMPVEALYEDARNLGPEEFEARLGSGFLLFTAGGSAGPKTTSSTEMVLDGEEDPGGQTAALAVVVFALRQKDGSSGYLVTLGRDPEHDVVIPDVSISRFHACAKRDSEGVWLLLDAGSTNGTTVNGVSVPRRGAGPPTALKPGDTVRLGQLDCTFTDARSLHDFVLMAAG